MKPRLASGKEDAQPTHSAGSPVDKLREIWEGMRERVANPLLISFVISWVVTNYKFIVVIADKSDFHERLNYIEYILYPSKDSHWGKLFWIPLAASILYVFVLPIVSLASTYFSGLVERWHNNMRIKAFSKDTLTVEDADELRANLALYTHKLEEELQDAKTARLDISQSAGANFLQISKILSGALLTALEAEAETWIPEEVSKANDGRTFAGSARQDAFVKKYGIKKKWKDTLLSLRNITDGSSAKHLALKENANEDEVLATLLWLSALGAVTVNWVDDGLYFKIKPSPLFNFWDDRPA